MFTGIIENRGKILKSTACGGQLRVRIGLLRQEKDLRLGESIAVDGVCLSVTDFGKKWFSVDIIRETLQATTLGAKKAGDRLNLERSLKLGDRLGGHFVTGHIDGTGEIVKIAKAGKNLSLQIKTGADIIKLLAVKGSIAVDGISLTIQSLDRKSFSVGLIPLTLRETTLGDKRAGSRVNLEADLITRYLKSLNRMTDDGSGAALTVKYLKSQGF